MRKRTPKTKTVIGVDVGGTKIHAALYRCSDFKELADKKIPTQAKRGIEAVLKDMVALIKELREESTVAVGIGMPGYIDAEKDILYRTPNIPHNKPVDLKKFFKTRLDLPVALDNDANLFTLAEFEMTWKKKISHFIGITLGTGLGGGIIANGQMVRGRDGLAGEFGHIAFTDKKELENFASGKGPKKTLGKFVGITLCNLIHIFNPQSIALGGSVSREFDHFKNEMWNEIKKRTIPESHKNLKIYVSILKNPATLGAALFANSKR